MKPSQSHVRTWQVNKRLTLIVDQTRDAKLHELGDLVAILQPHALDQFSNLQYLESRLR